MPGVGVFKCHCFSIVHNESLSDFSYQVLLKEWGKQL